MSDDLAEFLRRAAEKRAAQQKRPPQPQPEVRILEAADVEIIEAEPVSGADVAAMVTRHLDTSDIVQHAAQLGQLVDQADEKLASHLQQTFDHRLGHLGPGEQRAAAAETKGGKESPAAGVGAEQIVAMLRDPASIRSAIVLSEVLGRPEHRWR